MTPFYFNSCFGWLHDASGARGVVLCPALALEELCTHRFMRQLAGELAEAGLPTLRFDYQGTGDSTGTDLDGDRIGHWKQSIRDAIDWLRREKGVLEVALVGFRAGALLAAEVAAEREDVTYLAMLAPPPSGKTYLREMRALSMLIAETASQAAIEGEHTEVPLALEIGGFPVTVETANTWTNVDLAQLKRRPAAQVIVLGKPNAPGEDRLAVKLRELGSEVTQDVLPGYAQMQWNSSLAWLPADAFAGLITWLRRDFPGGASRMPQLPLESALTGAGWREEPIRFGENGALFGVRCEPTDRRKSRIVLFLNHGANHHIGWARNFVHLARRFAAQGVSSLRIDVAGLGDSPARDASLENQLYFPASQADVRAAIDWLTAAGYERVTVLGHCAGAHLGFHTAVGETRITDLILVNLVRFFWQPGDSLAVAMRGGFRSTDWYVAKASDLKVWQRIVRGDVNVFGITRAVLQRLGQRLAGRLKDATAFLTNAEDNRRKVRRWFRDLSRRGTSVLLLYGAEDGGLDEIALHAGPRANRLRGLPNLRVRVLENTDHNITSPHAFERYARVLEEYLGLRKGNF